MARRPSTDDDARAMRLVVFGTYDESVHPRTRVLREGLAEHGVEVTVCNEPLGVSTAERVRMLERPAGLPALAVRIVACWARLLVRRVRSRPRADVVLVGYLGHFDVLLARVLFPRAVVVLDYLVSAADTAVDRRREGGVLRLLHGLDRLACACADLVLVDTQDNVATVPARARRKATIVAVGAPDGWFRAPPTTRGDGPLRAVFFGLFTPLQGVPTILDGVRRARDAGLALELTVIGDGQDRAAARAVAPRDGVVWHDWVEPGELPAIVAGHDLCFGILGTTPKALRVVPNKAYQGAAAGCLVVTSDTSPQRRALPAATEFCRPGDPEALAASLLALGDPEALLGRRRESHAEARASFGPGRCVEPLLDRLGQGRRS